MRKFLFIFSILLVSYYFSMDVESEKKIPQKISQIKLEKNNSVTKIQTKIKAKPVSKSTEIFKEKDYVSELGNNYFKLSIKSEELSGSFSLHVENFSFDIQIAHGIGLFGDNDKKLHVRLEKISEEIILSHIAFHIENEKPAHLTVELLESDLFEKSKKEAQDSAVDPMIYAQSQYEIEMQDQEYQAQAREYQDENRARIEANGYIIEEQRAYDEYSNSYPEAAYFNFSNDNIDHYIPDEYNN